MVTLSEETLDTLITEIKDYQLTHGSLLKLVRREERTMVLSRSINVSVLPTPFPKRLFEEAIALQPSFNELYLRRAADGGWLSKIFKPLLNQDVLVTALWDIYLIIQKAEVVQDVACGIFRSDYMAQQAQSDHPALKQVEMNTFSVAGAVHAERIANMHRHFQRTRGRDLTNIPPNENTAALVKLLGSAHSLYRAATLKPTCVLMVVQPFNFNTADERPIEYGLWDAGIPCFRCDWPTVSDHTSLTADRVLCFQPRTGSIEYEVSVVYYRAGYDASEYDVEGKYTRLRLEFSRSIKCPDVLTHLTTLKAVQVALTQSVDGEEQTSFEIPVPIIQTFMPMHALGKDERVRRLALDPTTAKDYVLKPNLEGGGNNVYREEIPNFLCRLREEEWPKYTLMRLIESPSQDGVLMMPESVYQGQIVSELGVLGTCIWRGKGQQVEILSNNVAGWTFKTKPAEVDEMSVVKGYGCFDCPLLRN